jgi:hypothetical protein
LHDVQGDRGGGVWRVQDDWQRQAHRSLHQRMQHGLALLGLLQGHTLVQQRVVRQANLPEGDHTLSVLLHLGDNGFELLPGSIESFWVQAQRRPDLPWFLRLQR